MHVLPFTIWTGYYVSSIAKIMAEKWLLYKVVGSNYEEEIPDISEKDL